MPLPGKLPPQTLQIFNSVPSLINKTFPVPGRFRSAMPSQIAELSGLLTNSRGGRSLSYLGRPNFLSAYLHYFLPWNLYRLLILLHNLDFSLSSGDTITDLGSGPLTFTSALWIARPELRNIPLEFNCIDRSAPALEAGKKFFSALCAASGHASSEDSPWKINLIREDIDIRKAAARPKKQAALVCAVNMFNEIYENISHNNSEGLKRIAENSAQLMHSLALKDAFLLTVEPGVPQSGRFISFLRTALMELKRPPASPCTHAADCPCVTKQKRWCHFAFETTNAPKELQRLSAASRLPKERLVFSYLLAGAASQTKHTVRVLSDAFPLPDNRFGRYGCCEQGLVLLAGSQINIEKIGTLSLVKSNFASDIRDKKSGANIMEI